MAIELQSFGSGLSRPESVICTRNGDVFTSHLGSVVMHIRADGRQKVIGAPPKGVDFVPNGLCLLPDGSLLVANVGESGGVWRLDRSNELEPYCMDVDGTPLQAANFVNRDAFGRLWISVSTRSVPRNDAYNRDVADGSIVLVADGVARIVAEGLAFANESRLSTDGRYLVVCETAAARVSRFSVGADGRLSDRTMLTTFPAGTYPDGCEFDSEGHLWVASVVSNRLIRVAPDGSQQIVLEDHDPARVSAVELARRAGNIDRSHFYDDSGQSVKAITSVAFGGADLRTVFLGSLVAEHLVTFRSPVPGHPPEHWGTVRAF